MISERKESIDDQMASEKELAQKILAQLMQYSSGDVCYAVKMFHNVKNVLAVELEQTIANGKKNLEECKTRQEQLEESLNTIS